MIEEPLDAAGLTEGLPKWEPPSGNGRGAVGVPDWFPKDVHDLASSFLQEAKKSGPSERAIIQRLITDPRMKAVWTQLLQKDRTTGDFRLLANNLVTRFGRDRANEIHPASTIVVFLRAVQLGHGCLQLAEQKSSHYLEQAQRLRVDAKFFRRMIRERRLAKVSSRDVGRMAKQLDDAAETYEKLDQLARNGLFDKKQLLAKGFATNMAKTMRGLFGGDVMYGTVATLARVALGDDEITDAAVRKWCTAVPLSPKAIAPVPARHKLTAQQRNALELTVEQKNTLEWRHARDMKKLKEALAAVNAEYRNTRKRLKAAGWNLDQFDKTIKLEEMFKAAGGDPGEFEKMFKAAGDLGELEKVVKAAVGKIGKAPPSDLS